MSSLLQTISLPMPGSTLNSQAFGLQNTPPLLMGKKNVGRSGTTLHPIRVLVLDSDSAILQSLCPGLGSVGPTLFQVLSALWMSLPVVDYLSLCSDSSYLFQVAEILPEKSCKGKNVAEGLEWTLP